MLRRALPALPCLDVAAAVEHYRAGFGFEAPHQDAGFAVLTRDDVILNLWEAGDEGWRGREGAPVRSGAESFLAGTASCRIEVADVDALYAELAPNGVLHAVSKDGVTATDFGTREFNTVDLDGNLLTFFRFG